MTPALLEAHKIAILPNYFLLSFTPFIYSTDIQYDCMARLLSKSMSLQQNSQKSILLPHVAFIPYLSIRLFKAVLSAARFEKLLGKKQSFRHRQKQIFLFQLKPCSSTPISMAATVTYELSLPCLFLSSAKQEDLRPHRARLSVFGKIHPWIRLLLILGILTAIFLWTEERLYYLWHTF